MEIQGERIKTSVSKGYVSSYTKAQIYNILKYLDELLKDYEILNIPEKRGNILCKFGDKTLVMSSIKILVLDNRPDIVIWFYIDKECYSCINDLYLYMISQGKLNLPYKLLKYDFHKNIKYDSVVYRTYYDYKIHALLDQNIDLTIDNVIELIENILDQIFDVIQFISGIEFEILCKPGHPRYEYNTYKTLKANNHRISIIIISNGDNFFGQKYSSNNLSYDIKFNDHMFYNIDTFVQHLIKYCPEYDPPRSRPVISYTDIQCEL